MTATGVVTVVHMVGEGRRDPQEVKMAAQDKEGVWRGSCLNHPPHRFGSCVVFVSQEGTSKCRTCGCVARSHKGILLPNHSASDMQLLPLELIKSNRDDVRKAREAHLIDKGQTLEPKGVKQTR